MLKIICATLIILFANKLFAQNNIDDINIVDTITIAIDIFNVPKPLKVTLEFDIKKYQRTKTKKEFLDAQIQFHINDTITREREIRIKARGQFRNEYCHFPPFHLNIKKANLKNPHLDKTNKIKFVTHCKGGDVSTNYIFKEYIAYKIYEILSPYSFRTQLVKIKYIDTGRKNKETNTWGFIIEPEKMMAERHNAIPVKMDKLNFAHLDPKQTDIMTLFQYMIGNADYSVAGRHNIKVIKINEFGTQLGIPVPYDFDYSGLVNAYYAIPGENLGIKSVTERYYLGACRTNEQYQSTIDYFIKKKKEILNIVETSTMLNNKDKTATLNYINAFFEELNNTNFIKNRMRRTCR